VVSPCEHSNEPLGSIKYLEILETKRLVASQEELSPMELFSGHQLTRIRTVNLVSSFADGYVFMCR
jgi:hypothetical protein